MNQNENENIKYKITLLGDSTVGKTSIFRKLFTSKFREGTLSTVGIEVKTIKFEDVEVNTNGNNEKKCFEIAIYDTSGQERFRSIPRNYIRGSDAIILIYDITNRQSFENIGIWLKSISDISSNNNCNSLLVMLLGNKLDIAEEAPETRMIMTEEGENICSEKGIYWGGECSAKTFDESQLKEIFAKFIKQVYNKLGEEKKDNEKKNQQIVLISNKLNDKKRVKCCTPK
jgi:small GTP-binding protein